MGGRNVTKAKKKKVLLIVLLSILGWMVYTACFIVWILVETEGDIILAFDKHFPWVLIPYFGFPVGFFAVEGLEGALTSAYERRAKKKAEKKNASEGEPVPESENDPKREDGDSDFL